MIPDVKTTTGAANMLANWTGTGGILGILGLVILALIRQRGPWKKAATDERELDFARLRNDIAEAKAEAKEAREVSRRAEDTAQRLENMVACMRPAISILTAEVRRLDPDNPNNPALLQVQELMTMAAAGDMGMGKAMMGLASIKGTGE